MAGRGRFGKYGDLKRKELIRATRICRTDRATSAFASARAAREVRPGKGYKKK